jgi:hypothetical protein
VETAGEAASHPPGAGRYVTFGAPSAPPAPPPSAAAAGTEVPKVEARDVWTETQHESLNPGCWASQYMTLQLFTGVGGWLGGGGGGGGGGRRDAGAFWGVRMMGGGAAQVLDGASTKSSLRLSLCLLSPSVCVVAAVDLGRHQHPPLAVLQAAKGWTDGGFSHETCRMAVTMKDCQRCSCCRVSRATAAPYCTPPVDERAAPGRQRGAKDHQRHTTGRKLVV